MLIPLAMSSNDIHGIEHGWKVKSSDGHELGTVEETTDRYILVKSGLINADRHHLPAATLAHVRPELKEIDVDLSKEAFDAGDWSEPPAEGPRTEGSTLNEEKYSDDEIALAGRVRDPDRPDLI
jgi:hypothetical protein